ncbi:Rne/Rng family ribonuclease [Blattabacterium cuenoti]|uniref:Rne/Rng family ribonuclease n=1 Tax=Blattabacterium cuenoti TaxID=1653831 RepID=UPI00163B8A57|nr:Rne/Rng family ribonuclease [Blattabacterium cuenoti]
MIKKLVIHADEQNVNIAFLENDNLLEIHSENYKTEFSVGNIYLGIVKKISYGLNAAIIDIGHSKGAFLHYKDILFQSNIIINKKIQLIEYFHNYFFINQNIEEQQENKNFYSIENLLQIGQKILVQISKEAISNKGPKLTTKICIPGKNLILIPFSEKIYVSHKINNYKEKLRLVSIIQKIKPKNYGIIIRTASYNIEHDILKRELFFLRSKWTSILNQLITTCSLPIKVFSECSKTYSLLRDILDNDFKYIYCNNYFLCKEIHSYLSWILPQDKIIIKYYEGKLPIFKKYGITKQMQNSLGKHVPLKNGAYLVIEHTEALHVIDVNSGMINHIQDNYIEESYRLENIILKVNLSAATEIARQLRLRDMGGIIIVDFIDMSDPFLKQILYDHLKQEMKNDKAKHKILPPNEFGIVQFTRHRVKPELKYITKNNNLIELEYSPMFYIHHIEFIIETMIKNKFNKGIQLHIHPFVAAYLKKGFPSIQQKWFFKYKTWIKIISNTMLKYTEYQILNQQHKIILSSFKRN